MSRYLVVGVYKKFSLLCVFIIGSIFTEISYAQAESCGQPDFDRTQDRGVFVWQNCGTRDWFLRVTNGTQQSGVEVRAYGRLRLSKPFVFAQGFNLDPGQSGSQDTFDLSDPENIKFNFRVFKTAQDGFDFKFQNDSSACLQISTTPSNVPIVFGANNLIIDSPINLETLGSPPCNAGSVLPPILLLLSDDDAFSQ